MKKILKPTKDIHAAASRYANTIISTLREPFLVLDKDLRVISSNRSFYTNFRVAKEETVGRFLPKMGNGQWHIPRLIHLLKEILPKKKTVLDFEVEHNFEFLGRRIMKLNARRLRASKKLVVAGDELILLAIEDVTRERTATELLMEARDKDEAILASIGDAVMACDKNGLVVLFNRSAEVLTGYNAREVMGKRYNLALKFVRERDEKPSSDFIAEAIKTGHKTEMTNHTLLIRKDNSKIPVADSAAPIRSASGVLAGCVVVFRDVSHEREIDVAKTEFVSLAAHQLKNPPTAIKWLTEILLEDSEKNLTTTQKEQLGSVRLKNEQMISLINRLLDVSRIELGTFSVAPSLVDINLLVREVVKELGLVIKTKSLRVIEKYSETKLKISTDPNLLRMIIQNLLTNSVNYTPEKGRINIEVLLKRKGESFGQKTMAQNFVGFKFADTGYGIPKHQQSKIFTKLFRADNAKEKFANGTGLGLYIVKSIISKLGGDIWFESQENKGTIFFVVIPASGVKASSGQKQLTSSSKIN